MTAKKEKEDTEEVETPTADPSGEMEESSLTSPVFTAGAPAAGEDQEAQQKHYNAQAPEVKAGIGLVKVDGVDFRYIGVAPAQDEGAETPAGLKITGDNSSFTPLADVPFSNSIRIKDPKSGEFYYPADGVTSWAGCDLEGSKLFG